jgi:thiol-disulfide isomerase/thioredoxin
MATQMSKGNPAVRGMRRAFPLSMERRGNRRQFQARINRLKEARRLNTARQQGASNEAETKPRLVVFCSPTSGRCRRLDALLANIFRPRRNHEVFQVVLVNIEDRPDLAERFRIEVVPTLLVIEGHRVVRRIVSPNGMELKRGLAEWLR